MSLRTRLFVQDLEARENPSGPTPIDPYTTTVSQVVTNDSGSFLITIVTAVANGVSTITTTTTNQTNGQTNVLTETNSIYNIPLVP